jgi:DNA polymerase III sliding clamp (beta) subunit (PCNA family)
MKAKTLRNALDLPLAIANAAASVTPVLSHVLLAQGKALATNHVAYAEIELPIDDLGCCVPADRLKAALDVIVAANPDAEVKLAIAGSKLTITAPRMRHTMPVLPADMMPAPIWPDGEKAFTDWARFVSALEFGKAFVAGPKDLRYYLKGVGSYDGAICATDGHRAAIAAGESELRTGMIIPTEVVPLICGLTKGRTHAASETHLAIAFEGGRFGCRLVEGQMPDMRRVVPEKHYANVTTVNRSSLEHAASAMRKTRVAEFTRISVKDSMMLVEDDEASQGSTHVELEVKHQGAAWMSGIQSAYLLSAAQQLEGELVTISYEEGRPILFTGDKPGRRVVVMGAKV